MRTTEHPPTLPDRRSTPDLRRPVRPTRRRSTFLATALALVVMLLAGIVPNALAQGDRPSGRDASVPATRSLTVTHGPVVTTLTTSGSDGHQLGDLRVVSLPLSSQGGEEDAAGRLDASLLTMGIDQPNPGDEFRISTLVFTLGDPADQVVVTGSGPIPRLAPPSPSTAPSCGLSWGVPGASPASPAGRIPSTSPTTPGGIRSTSWSAPARPSGIRLGWQRRGGGGDRGDRGDRGQRERAAPRVASPLPRPAIIRTPLGQDRTGHGRGRDARAVALPHPRRGPRCSPHTHPGYQVARIVQRRSRLTRSSPARHGWIRGDGSSETVVAGQSR